MHFAINFLLLVAIAVTAIATMPVPMGKTSINATFEQKSFVTTINNDYWDALVAKATRAARVVPPIRVGRHYFVPTEVSPWTLSAAHRRHYTMSMTLFDMVVILSVTVVLHKCQQRRQWATEEDLEAEDIDDVEETHAPTLNTIPFSRALLLEAKAEIATRSTATRIQNECSVDEEIINLSVTTSEDDEFVYVESTTSTPINIDEEFTHVSADRASSLATFSHAEVFQLAEMASQAYLPLADNQGDGFEVTRFSSSISSGYVRAKGNEIIIAYKGTDTKLDLWTDAQGLPKACPDLLPVGGHIHQGFLSAFRTTWPQIFRIITTYSFREAIPIDDLDITVCGHSLGAAQATLAALQVAHMVRGAEQVRLITFGSPRVFSHEGAEYYNQLGLGARTLRVAENGVDPVTMVNLGSLGFKHVGINLLVVKPAGVLPHLMEGYMAGLHGLNASTFSPTHSVGTQRKAIHACRQLLRFGR